MTDITKNIISLRKSRNLTMKAVAVGADIPLGTYQHYEYAERSISIEALCKLADFYDISLDELVGRDSNKEKYSVCLKEIKDKYGLSDEETKLLQQFLNMPEDKRAALTEGVRYLQYTADFPLSEETTLGEIEDKIARQDGETYGSNVG